MEILLSCIEIMQFQNYLKQQHKRIIFNNSPDGIKLNLNQTWIPLSSILEGTHDKADKVKDSKIKAHHLFNKYIGNDARFQINISGTMRIAMTKKLEYLEELLADESINLNQIYKMFDECREEMIDLQTISFQRFRSGRDFDDVRAIFKSKSHRASATATIDMTSTITKESPDFEIVYDNIFKTYAM